MKSVLFHDFLDGVLKSLTIFLVKKLPTESSTAVHFPNQPANLNELSG